MIPDQCAEYGVFCTSTIHCATKDLSSVKRCPNPFLTSLIQIMIRDSIRVSELNIFLLILTLLQNPTHFSNLPYSSPTLNLPFNPRLLAFALLLLLTLMASPMPSFLSRLLRPFTSSTHLSLNPDGSAQAAAATTPIPENAEKCTVAAGCFWGVEHLFRRNFGGKGLLDARVGYIGGDTNNPSYRAVCSGRTGREDSLSIFLPTAFSLHPNLLLTTPRTPYRRRSPPNDLRSLPRHLPHPPRVLLQNARPHHQRSPGWRRWHPVPQRHLHARPRPGTDRAHRHRAGAASVVG